MGREDYLASFKVGSFTIIDYPSVIITGEKGACCDIVKPRYSLSFHNSFHKMFFV